MGADAGRPFRRRFLGVVTALAVLVAAFVGITFSQGPKLSSAQLDATGVVTRPGQQLRLFANQNVAPVARSQIAITPAAPISVSSAGEVIAVQFTQPLSYATDYRVTVSHVASAADGVSSTLSYRFRTASPPLYFLRRSGDAGPDEIVRTGIRSPTLAVAYSAQHISDFVVFAHAIAVATLDSKGDSALAIVGSGERHRRATARQGARGHAALGARLGVRSGIERAGRPEHRPEHRVARHGEGGSCHPARQLSRLRRDRLGRPVDGRDRR